MWSGNKIVVLNILTSHPRCCISIAQTVLSALILIPLSQPALSFEAQNNIPGTAPMHTSEQQEGHCGKWQHTNRSGKGQGVKTDANAVLPNRTL